VLTRVVASNFKSLGEDVELPMGRLVALVGINGAGKSNLLGVPSFVAHALSEGLGSAVAAENGFEGIGRASDLGPLPVTIAIETANDDGRGGFTFVLRFDGQDGYIVERERGWWSPSVGRPAEYQVSRFRFRGPPGLAPSIDPTGLALPLVAADGRFTPLHEELRSVGLYTLLPPQLRGPQSHYARAPMAGDGSNWAGTLEAVLASPDRRARLLTALNALLPEVVDARVDRIGSLLLARFQHVISGLRRKQWLDASQESDGTLRIASLLTALLQPRAPRLIGVEEPELYIHPGALAIVHDHLAEASRGSQVIFTTHSPDLLDLLPAEAIRIVDRRYGATRVSTMSPDQQRLVREHLTSPGELLRIEGLHAA
jgi:predicted ATPase